MARAFSIEDGGLAKQSKTNATKNREFIDLDLSFAVKGAGDVYKKTAVSAVNQSLKNLLLTQRTEIPFNAYMGANLNSYLFELADDASVGQIKHAIQEQIRVFEPRAQVQEINCIPDADNNQLDISIIYNIINQGDQLEFFFKLSRLR